MINKEHVYAQIKRSGNLPTLPEILVKLIEVCDNDETPLSEIAAIVRTDPSLSFRVLQVVNSSFYGFQSPFTGIERAVVYLGANSIKNIAVTASIHQVFDRKCFKSVKHFNLSNFWWHSLMCATLSKRIAKKTGYNNIEEAYLSGLLHDVGRLILVSTFPKAHGAILLEAKDIRNELWAENQLIGVTHCEAGGWLINNWHLNSMMADAIRYHHESIDKIQESFPLVKIVYLANLLKENNQAHERNFEAGELLFGLDSLELVEIVDGAKEEVIQVAENLNMIAKPPPALSRENRAGVILPAENENTSIPEITLDDLQPSGDQDDYHDSVGNEILNARIKGIALLSGFLENLTQAEDTETIIGTFEQSMGVLFGIENVLFFLPDKDNILLKGYASKSSKLRHLSEGLVIPIQKSTSLIIQALYAPSLTRLAANGKEWKNLADAQLFSALRSKSFLFVPVIVNKKPTGVILLGLSDSTKIVSKGDCQLVQAIARQVGVCLLLESMKIEKAEEIESERMAAISMTARKLAHEINNPLGIITNYLTTMRLKLSSENGIQEELGIIGEEINRISTLVSQMDTFSQTAVPVLERTNVNKVIKDIIHIVRPSLFAGSGKVISFRPDENLPQIMTSPSALKQVMINLIKNASEAIDEGGNVEIMTRMSGKDSQEKNVLRPPGIEIVIKDSGPGIPEIVVNNLYEPFFTTKKNGHSGLGLSIVHKTIKDLQGYITCTNKPADGTAFSIYLPLVTGSLH